jgi:hypothetical protein
MTLDPWAIKLATEKAAAEGLKFSRCLEEMLYVDYIYIQSVYK